jgi:hypothetical protein
MTLLVLDLKLPPDSGNLPRALRRMLPAFLACLITFASVAGYREYAAEVPYRLIPGIWQNWRAGEEGSALSGGKSGPDA